jgi:arylsulfatase A-like enzyme/lysophospholipase L1-like esterase
VLQQLLDDRHGAGRYQVLNAGKPGHTSLQGLLYLREHGLALRPAIVIFGYGFNDGSRLGDVERQLAVERRLMPLMLADDFLFQHSRFYNFVRARTTVARSPNRPPRVDPARFERNLGEIVRLARDHGAQVLALSFSGTQAPPYAAPFDAVVDRFAVPVVVFRGPRVDFVHPTVEGYRALAEDVAARLQQVGYLSSAGAGTRRPLAPEPEPGPSPASQAASADHEADTTPVHLIDHVALPPGTSAPPRPGRLIHDVWRRVLPSKPSVGVPLPRLPRAPRLRFAIGLQPQQAVGSVRFEVLLEREGEQPTRLYGRDLGAPGWVEEEVDLPARDADGARLVFQKTLLEGPATRLLDAHFAEPILVSGTPQTARSVVLISLDTLRADRVGAYGYAPARTPALDRLAADGVWYANAYSASTWTYPSHASLLYGLYPASLPPLDEPGRPPASTGPRPLTLAERLRGAGYLTAGFTGGGFMSTAWGLQWGFDLYYQFAAPTLRAGRCPPERFDGDAVFTRAIRWLREHGRQPFFLFLHTYDAHDRCEVWPSGLQPFDPWPDPGPRQRERVSRYYDDRIAAADALFGRLAHELEALGLSERVTVVVTSDHGEALWEHGFFGHGCTLTPFEPVIRVPLIVRAPHRSRERGRIDQPVSAVDIAPTLLALLGVAPADGLEGQVLPGLGLPSRPPSSAVFVHCDQQLAVRVGDHKLIAGAGKPSRDAVYDLARDPDERHDVSAAADSVTRLLQGYASEYGTKGAPGAGAYPQDLDRLDDAARERLRALGYVQ